MTNGKKSLYELGEEYERHIELQKHFIKLCREEIKKAELKGDSNAVYLLKSNLNKFYEIKRDMEETALHLKSYYLKGTENGEKSN